MTTLKKYKIGDLIHNDSNVYRIDDLEGKVTRMGEYINGQLVEDEYKSEHDVEGDWNWIVGLVKPAKVNWKERIEDG